MCTAVDNRDIIVILSDDEDEEQNTSCRELSVQIVEEVKKSNDSVLSASALDEDLVVTFSRPAEVMPHARYDCPIHPFTPTDCEVSAPAPNNQLFCDQCYCYICDNPASSCEMWCRSGVCHCNSHQKSDYWKNLRYGKLLGGLRPFNLTLSEIDASLRSAEVMLELFRRRITEMFATYLKGKPVEEYGLQTEVQGFVHDYTPVYEFVSSFLNKAQQLAGKAGAVLALGAAEYFIKHFEVFGSVLAHCPTVTPPRAKEVLLQRVISSVQTQMVMEDFTPEFSLKLQDFYKRINFPTSLKNMKNSLCVRPWLDVLLVSVLKGQNVSGVRKDKGKKDLLVETVSVVLLRTEVLQRQRRYRELCRYLRVVQTGDSSPLQQVKDLIPFFLCMDGNFSSALSSLFPSVKAPASRFTPHLFLFYLCIFNTATAPRLVVTKQAQLCYSEAEWEPIKDAKPLTRAELVMFALNVRRCCPAVFIDSQSWISLLKVVNTPRHPLSSLPEPSPQFLHETRTVLVSFLLEEHVSKSHFPQHILEVYPDQALLLLVTGVLALRIQGGVLRPALPVLNTFQENVWALEWLWGNLSSERLSSFSQELSQEMDQSADGQGAYEVYSSQMKALSQCQL